MQYRHLLQIVLSFGIAPLVGCTATQNIEPITPAGGDAPLIRHQQEPAEQDGTKPSGLVLEVRDINVVSREARISGRVRNDYDQTVSGIRYRVELFSTDGERSLGTEYFEMPTDVESGATSRFRLTLQSMYIATIPRVMVEAFPVELGGRTFPAPESWN